LPSDIPNISLRQAILHSCPRHSHKAQYCSQADV